MKTILFLVAAFATATPALADGETPRSARVSFADLDLTTGTGQAMLETRINHAVRAVCNSNSFELGARIAENNCRRETRDRAVRDMGVAVASAARRTSSSLAVAAR